MSAHAIFAGSAAYKGLVSMEKVMEELGAEYAQNSMLLCGPGTLHPKAPDLFVTRLTVFPGEAILSYPIDLGQDLQLCSHGL